MHPPCLVTLYPSAHTRPFLTRAIPTLCKPSPPPSYMNYSGSSLIGPVHVVVSTSLIFAHHCALVAYEALASPGWSSVNGHDDLRWLDTVLVVYEITLIFSASVVFVIPFADARRRQDFFAHTRAKLLHNVAHDLVVNFLPPPVMKAVQERVAHAAPKDSPGDTLEDSEIVARAYDPACVLQSDIVGFTALGSRVSPQELCRWGSASTNGKFLRLLFWPVYLSLPANLRNIPDYVCRTHRHRP